MTVATYNTPISGVAYSPGLAERFKGGAPFSRGRSLGDGYLRGVGLEYGELTPAIDSHPLFRKAADRAIGRTVMAADRVRNLFLLVVNHLQEFPSQNIVEFGSYRGGSLAFLGTLLQELYPKARVYGFDTFAGMPESDPQFDFHGKGEFADTSTEELDEYFASHGLDNIHLVKGLVEDTFPTALLTTEKFALAHIDLDLYGPILHIQSRVWDHMVPGGYVVYDDATASTCMGATQAVEEMIWERKCHSEQIYPHFVFRA